MHLKIEYWSQISHIQNNLIPVFFFYPSLEFLSFIRQKGQTHVPIVIEGTHLYDGLHYVTVDELTRYGSCNVDYSHDSRLYAIFLVNIPFTLYPIQNGYFQLAESMILT
jgi:hypothetical protein